MTVRIPQSQDNPLKTFVVWFLVALSYHLGFFVLIQFTSSPGFLTPATPRYQQNFRYISLRSKKGDFGKDKESLRKLRMEGSRASLVSKKEKLSRLGTQANKEGQVSVVKKVTAPQKKPFKYNDFFTAAPSSSGNEWQGARKEGSGDQVLDKFFAMANITVQSSKPDDFDQDQLNPIEKILYGFHKRVAQLYYNSFITVVTEFSKHNRAALKRIDPRGQRFTAEATYDGAGNLRMVKIIRATDGEVLQSLFLKIVENIYSIPNPPQMYVDQKRFQIFFTLNFG